jgi:hypothetical protein
MIVYLKNNEIDRDQWDNCIRASRHFKPYALSWYLDIMAPGWDALVDDDYDAVFPIPGFSRLGINYISTPIFLQQLGVYSPDTSENQKVHEFIDYMPQLYKLIDLNIGQKISYHGYKVTERVNLELDLIPYYDTLVNNYSSDCRRNIKITSKKKFELISEIAPKELIDLFRQNRGKELKNIKDRDYQRLSDLMNYCVENDKGRIIGVKSPRKGLLFGIFMIETQASITLLFTAGTPESRDLRVSYFIVDEIIREFSGTRKRLDFAGSSIPSVASFMESFGCRNVPYYRIYRNRLPWPVNILK